MGVKILRKEGGGCTVPNKINCHFENYSGAGCGAIPRKDDIFRCGLTQFTEITAAEFNASTGKKWRVKKDGRVLPYEDKLYLHINGEKYPVFPDDTVEEIEKRINDDLEYAEITIIMDDKK